jgi:hypothetical protein
MLTRWDDPTILTPNIPQKSYKEMEASMMSQFFEFHLRGYFQEQENKGQQLFCNFVKIYGEAPIMSP